MERKVLILFWIKVVLCALESVSAMTMNEIDNGVNATPSSRWRLLLSVDASEKGNNSLEHGEKIAKEQHEIRPRKYLTNPSILVTEKLGDEGPSSPALEWKEKVTKEKYPQSYNSSLETRNDNAERGKITHLLKSIRSPQISPNVGGKRVRPKRGEIYESQKKEKRIMEYFENKARQKREGRTDAREVDDRVYFPDTYTKARINIRSVNDERMSESFTGDLQSRNSPGDDLIVESIASCNTSSSESFAVSIPFKEAEDEERGKEKIVNASLEETPGLDERSGLIEDYTGTLEKSTKVGPYFLLRAPIRCTKRDQTLGRCPTDA